MLAFGTAILFLGSSLLAVYAGLEIWFFVIVLHMYEYLGECERVPVAQPVSSTRFAHQSLVPTTVEPVHSLMKKN